MHDRTHLCLQAVRDAQAPAITPVAWSDVMGKTDERTGRRRPLDQGGRAPSSDGTRTVERNDPASAGEQAVLLGSSGAPTASGRDSARAAEATRQTGG
ncbi:hypothetical protein GCM10027188_07300 [Lysobacter humi (ex Lee et al. 2017)]